MKNIIGVTSGVIAGIVIGGFAVVGANQRIQAMQNTEIKIKLNGEIQNFVDENTWERQYPITYNNRTYLPLRNVAEISGLMVDYDEDTNTAILEKDLEDNTEDGFDSIFKKVLEYDKRTGNYNSIRKIWLNGEKIYVCCSGEGSSHIEIYDVNGKIIHSGNGDFGESDVNIDEFGDAYYLEYNSNGEDTIIERVYIQMEDGVITTHRENESKE